MTSLFDTTHQPVKPPKKATYLQYLKSCTKTQLKQTFQVERIWLPGKFENYTIETHAWRLRVVSNDPIYDLMADYTKNLEGSNDALGIKVTDRDNAAFIFVPMANKQGEWRKLGTMGFLWEF